MFSSNCAESDSVIIVCIFRCLLCGREVAREFVIGNLDLSPKKLLLHANDVNSWNNQDIKNYPTLFDQSETIMAFEYTIITNTLSGQFSRGALR